MQPEKKEGKVSTLLRGLEKQALKSGFIRRRQQPVDIFKVAEINAKLKENKANMVIAPSPIDAIILNRVHAIPQEKIGILACIWVGKGKTFLIMTKRQYAYYLRKEREILSAYSEGKERSS